MMERRASSFFGAEYVNGVFAAAESTGGRGGMMQSDSVVMRRAGGTAGCGWYHELESGPQRRGGAIQSLRAYETLPVLACACRC
jgi:hypothetical protein